MKHLFTTLFAILLTACASVQPLPEATQVNIVDNVDTYVPVSHPELPKAVKAPNVHMKLLTPYVLHTELSKVIDEDVTLTNDQKEEYKEMSLFISSLWLEKADFMYYAMDSESGAEFSSYFNHLKAFLKSNKEVIEFYRTKPLYVKEPDTYSLEK